MDIKVMDKEINTFSIGAYDPDTGCFGVATASRFPAVGSIVPHAWADTGLVITQSQGILLHAVLGRRLLESGEQPSLIIEKLTENDSSKDVRQFAVMDRHGVTAAYTGAECTGWAGHLTGDGVVCLGNMLTGGEVVGSMMEAYASSGGMPLWDRLVSALAAGEEAGGDKRGKQAAALIVVKKKGGYDGYSDRLIDLRVDDSREPVEELSRILSVWRDFYDL